MSLPRGQTIPDSPAGSIRPGSVAGDHLGQFCSRYIAPSLENIAQISGHLGTNIA
jgi:hypothetical protein